MNDSAQSPTSPSADKAPAVSEDDRVARDDCIKLHLRFGWWTLLFFLLLGITLELMHGFKVGWYLDVGNETRRLMWTLAHAHGTLLSMLNILFAATLSVIPVGSQRARTTASVCLRSASLLLPGGFFLGGVFIYSGDPGLGILLVPPGGLLLLLAVYLTARSTSSPRNSQ